ncbi:hypothetical protein CAEBREN_00751 [Caenorhabditis brenneri]|uniref:CUB-like domain-containing protein n=1 Tax=Caenorhabditis brenneri TaxID=135651 RepID=G0MRT2_CAEBE|nr:hypothetical protein CAEBREN_00751 [Caenorhabditis brenneri]
MKHASFLFYLLVSIIPCLSVNPECPKAVITQNTPTGSFPSVASGLFPADYSCEVQFQIPVGQVVKFNIQNNISSNTDSFIIQDSASTIYQLQATDKIFYAPATTAKIQITTKTSTSSFYFSWTYIDVTNFGRIQKTTGSIISLNLTANSYYQVSSTINRVAFHIGSIHGDYDSNLNKVYVYDGEDLNANFIGNMEFFSKNMTVSSGKYLTIVNFYDAFLTSYGVANDYSAISNYEDYSLVILNSGRDLELHRFSGAQRETVVTLYLIDYNESYIQYLRFTNPNVAGQEVRVKPLTPTQNYANLLTYNVNEFNSSLPQQIATNIFTVSVYQSNVFIGFRSRSDNNWSTAYPGRSGIIYSPSLWSPKTEAIAPYFVNFTSSFPVKFIFDIQSILFSNMEDELKVVIGSDSCSYVVADLKPSIGAIVKNTSVGTYMTTSFTGTTNASYFIMKFRIEESVETTTKSTEVVLNFMTLALIFCNLV